MKHGLWKRSQTSLEKSSCSPQPTTAVPNNEFILLFSSKQWLSPLGCGLDKLDMVPALWKSTSSCRTTLQLRDNYYMYQEAVDTRKKGLEWEELSERAAAWCLSQSSDEGKGLPGTECSMMGQRYEEPSTLGEQCVLWQLSQGHAVTSAQHLRGPGTEQHRFSGKQRYMQVLRQGKRSRRWRHVSLVI